MWKATTRALIAGLQFLVLLVPAAHAQLFTGSISCVVTDPNQATVADAQVTLENTGTSSVKKTASAADGRYTFSQLEPGNYVLTVGAPGFKGYKQNEISLHTSQALELNPQLSLGDVSQEVSVNAAPPLLSTEDANKSVTLSSNEVLALPIPSHNALAAVWSQSGVVGVRTGNITSPTSGDQNMSRFALNGGRDESAAVLVDGISVTSGDWGGAFGIPSIETVQEFQVLRNTFDTQYGKTDGGVVSIITKGGSNAFHGGGFEYLQNDVLNANSWGNNRSGLGKTVYQLNQFGGNIGGPAWKSKRLFFFGNYDAIRQGAPQSLLTSVPTLLQRSGDFSQTYNSNGTLATIYNPFSTVAGANGAYTRTAFPGNRVPASLLNPVGMNILNLYPAPNLAGDPVTGANNFSSSGKGVTRYDRMDLRGDWVATDKLSLFGTVTRLFSESSVPTFFGKGADSNNAGANPAWRVLINGTYTPAPNWVVNVVAATATWNQQSYSPSLAAGVNGSTIGLPSSLVSQLAANTLPQFNITNYGQIGNPRYLYYLLHNNDLQVNASRLFAKHAIKFGFQLTAQILNDNDESSGTFSFGRGMTSGPTAATDSSTTGNALASLLLGAMASGSTNSVTYNAATAVIQKYPAWYLQDTWKVTSRLTVNYGIRYEIQNARTERYNRFNHFDPNVVNPLSQATGLTLHGGLEFADAQNRALWNTDYTNAAPRIGIAYKITDKLVFRSGYGIYYSQNITSANGPTDGFSLTNPVVASVNNAGFVPQNLISNPFPTGLLKPIGNSLGLLTDAGIGVNAITLNHPTPYVQSFSADFQYQPFNNTLIEIGYQGSQGRKLPIGYLLNLDQLNPSYLALGSALNASVNNPFFGSITSGALSGKTISAYQLLLPYPQFTNVNLISDAPAAGSSYNALNAKYNQRLSNSVTVLATYQWSKAIDNTSETQGWEIGDQERNAYNLSQERSISAHDVPQYFTTSVIWDLPVGRGKRYGAGMNKAVDAVIGGWQVSTILSFSSGLPLQFSCTNTLSTYGFQACRPNITSLSALTAVNQTTQQWFNTSASVVSAPAPYTIGTAPRYISNLRYGATDNVNLTLRKSFALTERLRLAFQASAYNLANTPQYGRANTTVGSTTFGQVTGLAPGAAGRQVELGARIQF